MAVTNTESDKVRGYIYNNIFTCKGIPNAEAERFMPSVKPKPWTNMRASLVYGPVALSLDPTTNVQNEGEFIFHHDWGFTNEDCMRLNVWTPNINDGENVP